MIMDRRPTHPDQVPAAVPQPTASTSAAPPVRYQECRKNHAAAAGGHVVDGCGEFMPSGDGNMPEALQCAACECHRNFHRKEAADGRSWHNYDYNPVRKNRTQAHFVNKNVGGEACGSRKRFRTKFSQLQKEKMKRLAEKMGWRIQKEDEQQVLRFCQEQGLKRQVFKVWMHNNKPNSNNNP